MREDAGEGSEPVESLEVRATALTVCVNVVVVTISFITGCGNSVLSLLSSN